MNLLQEIYRQEQQHELYFTNIICSINFIYLCAYELIPSNRFILTLTTAVLNTMLLL